MKTKPWYTKNTVFLFMTLFIAPIALLLLLIRWRAFAEEDREGYALFAAVFTLFSILNYSSILDHIPLQTRVIGGAIVFLILFALVLWYGITKKD